MSELTILKRLVAAGLSITGAVGVVANIRAESLCKANNVEDRCAISDEVYTAQVDSGAISVIRFANDQYGYGLCQWTYPPRKLALINFAKSRGVSIGDEAMQVDFLLQELKNDWPGLLQYLKEEGTLLTATSKVCTEFERPAINNISVRYEFAQELANKYEAELRAVKVGEKIETKPLAVYEKKVSANMPNLDKGAKGLAVGMIQHCLIAKGYLSGIADNDFGNGTKTALEAFKKDYGINEAGTPAAVWEALYK